MITLGDLVFRCVLCLMLVFFWGFLFDVYRVLKRLVRQRADRQRATGQKVVWFESDGKDQTVSFESVQEADATAPNPVATDLEANPTCVDKDAFVVYRVNLSTGRYGFTKNRQGC